MQNSSPHRVSATLVLADKGFAVGIAPTSASKQSRNLSFLIDGSTARSTCSYLRFAASRNGTSRDLRPLEWDCHLEGDLRDDGAGNWTLGIRSLFSPNRHDLLTFPNSACVLHLKRLRASCLGSERSTA